MSRFEQAIEVGLRQIADRATPSPDAWDSILTRIADQEPFHETEIIMLTDNTTRTKRWPLYAAAAAVAALLVGGIALLVRDDGPEAPAIPPSPTTPEVLPAPGPEAETGTLPAVGSQVAPGTYTSDASGVPVTLDLGEGSTAPWTVVSNDVNGIQLISDDTGREFMAIGRIGSWMSFDEARDEQTRGTASIAPDNVDGWIEANGIIDVDSGDVEVGGRPAKYRMVRLDTTPGATADWCPLGATADWCPLGEQPCLWAAAGSADTVAADATPIPFSRDRQHAIWLVDMGEFEPLIILGIPNLADEDAWFEDVVQPIVDSIQLGEPAPAVEGGTARVPLRMTVDSAWSGTRVDGDPDADGVTPISGQLDFTGGMTGEAMLTGERRIIPPDGDVEGTADYLFTGSIDGVGTGTFSISDEWSKINGNFSFTGDPIQITNGTDDFEGMTGTVEIVIETSTSDGPTETVTGTMTITITLPHSG